MHASDTVGERFLLLHLVGAGGMGEVYKAEDQETGQHVALKTLHERRSEAAAARFAREARILSELSHPHIVRYFAHGALPSGEPYLAMEWLEGEDLSARLSRGPLALAESVALGIQVADALGFAHAQGVVHRDLKPSNIFLSDGQIEGIKLLDFGIAQLGAASRMTKTGALMGTPGYMAPEQARASERIDARADVFSLGCVLFECLTGEPAFTGVHLASVLARILFDEPPRVREKRPEVPEALSHLIVRMLAKWAEDRPEDGAAVAEALRALGDLSSARASAPPAGSPATALTDSEQRAVAVILLWAPARPEVPARPEAPAEDLHLAETHVETLDAHHDTGLKHQAEFYGGRRERLLDGSDAVMLTSSTLATDLAAQAARCALALRAQAPGHLLALAMGRGESTGQFAMGRAIDRAAGLLDRAASGERAPILLDEVAAGLLDARFDVRENEAGFALHEERELAEGTRTLLGKATPCVGRDWERSVLEQLFDECVGEGMARAVLVTSPAGGGKSRLAQELLRHVRASVTPAAAIWIGRGDSLRAGSAFGLLGQAIRGACGIREGEPLKTRRSKLSARVSERVLESERRRVTEFVGEIIGTPFFEEESLPLRAARREAQLMNDQMQSAFVDFLAAECAATPVLILLEDLHWGDRPTAQFLDRALKELRHQPLFILALARPEVHELFPKLWSKREMQEIRLKQLNRKAIERLARYVLSASAGAEIIERLVRLSEGNAFYLEELIRRAAEGRGADLPETVVAMVQSRLGALNDEARRVLRAASVFGETFWAGGVAVLLGGAERAPRVRARLAELIERELVINRGESRFLGEEEFAFRHALLREGAFAMLTAEDSALGHRLAGEWLEQRGEQDMLVLAEHFEKGGDGARAGAFYLGAAEQVTAGGDAVAAMDHVRRGLALGVSEELRTRLLGTICVASYWQLEKFSAVVPYAEELSRLAPPGSPPWILGMFVKLLSAMQAGRFDEFMSILGVLQAIEPDPDTGGTLAIAFGAGIYQLDIAGQFEEANRFSERFALVARVTEDHDRSPSILWRVSSAIRSACVSKDPWSGLEHANIAAALAEEIRHRRYIALGKLFLSTNLWFLGGYPDAERTLSEITLPDEELSHAAAYRPFCLAWLLAERGAFSEAQAWASRAVALGQARSMPFDEAQGRWALAEVLRRAGELDAAEKEIHAALAVLGLISPLDHPGALATLAALRLAQGRPAEALAVAEEAMGKAASMGACSIFFRDAFLHLTHAECLEATGDHAAAREAVTRARAWILAVAAKIGDPAYRRSYLEVVPENRKTLELARMWLGESA
jgi:eukaryotic-like serine/threonine-protein kinase